MQQLFTIALLASIAACVHSQLVGGLTEQDPNDPEFMLKAWRAMESINNNVAWNSTPYLLIPIEVVSAKSQVISGVRYVIDVLYGESRCTRGGQATLAMIATYCGPKAGGARALFRLNVVERPWTNYEQYSVEFIRNVDANEKF